MFYSPLTGPGRLSQAYAVLEPQKIKNGAFTESERRAIKEAEAIVSLPNTTCLGTRARKDPGIDKSSNWPSFATTLDAVEH